MITLLTVASLMFVLSAASLYHGIYSDNYRVDAAPAGAFIIIGSAIVLVVSLILFGVVAGMVIAGTC